MEGLLDFIKTPVGQGLLSTVFGGLAGARRGQPFNSLGRAGLAGLSGYSGALERNAQTGKEAQALELQKMQMDDIRAGIVKRTKLDALGPQFFTPGTPAQAGRPAIPGITPVDSLLPPEFRIGSTAMPGTPAKPASYDLTGYANAAMGIDPSKGIDMLTALQKETPFGKVDAKDYTPESVAKFAQSRSFGDLIPRSKMEVSPGGQVYDPFNIKPGVFMQDPNKAMAMSPTGPIPNVPFQQYEIGRAVAGASRTSNQLINSGPKAFDTELGKLDAKQLDEWRNGALSAKNTLLTAKKLDDAAANGAYSGGAANLKMTVGSYINGLTGATPKGQIGSEMYTAEANNLILAQIKQLGTNPSNADLTFIQKTVPQLSTNADARKQMTQFMREKAQASIELYQRADTHARKNSGLGGFQDIQSSAGVDDLVKKYGGR